MIRNLKRYGCARRWVHVRRAVLVMCIVRPRRVCNGHRTAPCNASLAVWSTVCPASVINVAVDTSRPPIYLRVPYSLLFALIGRASCSCLCELLSSALCHAGGLEITAVYFAIADSNHFSLISTIIISN